MPQVPDEILHEQVETPYRTMFGFVPDGVSRRLRLYEAERETDVRSLEVLTAIEHARDLSLSGGTLHPRVVQLLLFAIYAAKLYAPGATNHAACARYHGASLGELLTAAQVAWVAGGAPAYGIACEAIDRAWPTGE